MASVAQDAIHASALELLFSYVLQRLLRVELGAVPPRTGVARQQRRRSSRGTRHGGPPRRRGLARGQGVHLHCAPGEAIAYGDGHQQLRTPHAPVLSMGVDGVLVAAVAVVAADAAVSVTV